jgi:hypothetical protein
MKRQMDELKIDVLRLRSTIDFQKHCPTPQYILQRVLIKKSGKTALQHSVKQLAGLVFYFVFAIFGVAAGNASATITTSDYGASIIDYLITFGTSEAIIFARYYGIVFLFIAICFSLSQYFVLMRSKAQKAKETEKELDSMEKTRSVLATKLNKEQQL